MRIEFKVGQPGAPADGASNYFNAGLAGENYKVFREGNYQYIYGTNRVIKSGTGITYFIPALQQDERILITTQ